MICVLGRSPGEGNGYPLQYSCLKNFTNREAWRAAVHGVAKELDIAESTDGDCSHEINRHLLLGRNAMTNPDSILKIRDITLLSRFHIIKAMVFLVVMYRYESWTIKKAEHQRIDAF